MANIPFLKQKLMNKVTLYGTRDISATTPEQRSKAVTEALRGMNVTPQEKWDLVFWLDCKEMNGVYSDRMH